MEKLFLSWRLGGSYFDRLLQLDGAIEGPVWMVSLESMPLWHWKWESRQLTIGRSPSQRHDWMERMVTKQISNAIKCNLDRV
jgi:hypothetical protein